MSNETNGQLTGAYQAESANERHLQSLLANMPHMQEIQAKLERHRAAGQVLAKYSCVDDLEGDLEQLESRAFDRDAIDPKLYEQLVNEKRLALRGEKTRFERDLAHSPFASVPEASRARLSEADALALEDELNRFREDYAYTLARCEADAAKAGEAPGVSLEA